MGLLLFSQILPLQRIYGVFLSRVAKDSKLPVEGGRNKEWAARGSSSVWSEYWGGRAEIYWMIVSRVVTRPTTNPVSECQRRQGKIDRGRLKARKTNHLKCMKSPLEVQLPDHNTKKLLLTIQWNSSKWVTSLLPFLLHKVRPAQTNRNKAVSSQLSISRQASS